MSKKNIIIIGGGPASLMLACSLNADKFNISIYEKNQALARKFLVAGKGGFNLTHSENLTQFENRYNNFPNIHNILNSFTNEDFRNWLLQIGIPTYVGTSKRVFPKKGIKPIEVLQAIEVKLIKNKVKIHFNHEWLGWKNKELLFKTSNHEIKTVKSEITVFALGGASWKVTGSDGSWVNLFKEKGVNINPFYPSNCAYKINWPEGILPQIEGKALKNCVFQCGTKKKKGEAILTRFGIEGSGIYSLSSEIRKQLSSFPEVDSEILHSLKKSHHNNKANLIIDFKPELTVEEIKQRFNNCGKISIKDFLEKKLNLTATQVTLIKYFTNKEEYQSIDVLIQYTKSYKLNLVGFAPIDDAISTVGGIPWEELNPNFELKKLPNNYCIGEMVDWDAPTGGYLLQACFSMGKFLADKLNFTL